MTDEPAVMGEDLGNREGMFDGGEDRQGTATLRTLFNIDSETRLRKPSLAFALRAGVRRSELLPAVL